MTRQLTSHRGNALNNALDIQVLDEPGAGGANHLYGIYGFHTATNASSHDKDKTCVKIDFQCGPIGEVGKNGVTNEALLAIVLDRLTCFQLGPFACVENAVALEKVREAMQALHSRTSERLSRGVEGTHQK